MSDISPVEVADLPRPIEDELPQELRVCFEIVDLRYDAMLSPEQKGPYKAHYREVTRDIRDKAEAELTDRSDRYAAIIAGIFHDFTKGDNPSVGYEEVPLYTLATHGTSGAAEARKILQTNREVVGFALDKAWDEVTPDERDAFITKVYTAIEAHMGPNPGFMEDLRANKVNPAIERINEQIKDTKKAALEKVPEYSRANKAGRIAEILLAADMRSLAGKNGIQKVITDRAVSDFFKDQDKKTVEKFKALDIGLSIGEAAALSAYESALSAQSAQMIANEKDRRWIAQATEEALNFPQYKYDEEVIDLRKVVEKRETYLEALQVSEGLNKAGSLT